LSFTCLFKKKEQKKKIKSGQEKISKRKDAQLKKRKENKKK
jgi:hypothetical protein